MLSCSNRSGRLFLRAHCVVQGEIALTYQASFSEEGFKQDAETPDMAVGLLGLFPVTVLHVFLTFVLCLVLTILPIAVYFINPMLAIACQLVLVTGTAIYLTQTLPMVVVTSLIFQNIIISLFADYLVSADDYDFLRGYNFLTMMIGWLWLFGTYAINWRDYAPKVHRIMLVCIFGFSIVGFYFLMGAMKNPTGAVIYLRNVITPLVMFQVFFLVALRGYRPIMPFMILLSVVVAVLGYIELIDRSFWMDITNGWHFWDVTNYDTIKNLSMDKEVQESGQVIRGILDTMRVDFLNTPLLGDKPLQILRMQGPNLHPISYSYCLSFLIIILLLNRQWFIALLLVPLIMFASAKGSLILIFLGFCGLLARKLFGAIAAIAGLILVLVVYIALGIITGLNIGDFHVIGFMGGFYNFFGAPLGNGLGDGGNLVSNFASLDWPAYQAAGRTPVAMESSVGVMLHQLGIGTFGVLGVYIWIAFQVYKLSFVSRLNLHSMAAYMILIVVVNGIFQEEAIFSPLALGLVLSLSGHILGTALHGSQIKQS